MKVKASKMRFLLIISYVVMILVSLYLSVNLEIAGIIINIIFFAIVLGIFVYSFVKFSKANSLAKQLRHAEKTILQDYHTEGNLLWTKYKELNIEYLFPSSKSILYEKFSDYKKEMLILETSSGGSCKCDLDSYINKELIDSYVKKNLLNTVPGVMTGLGILGTFVGLSLGLQQFNTGSADEIASSIPPLMNGIKVAFHTSIYGMLFSLIFNWVYKSVMEDTYKALDSLLDTFNICVSNDSFNENFSIVQKLLNDLPQAIGENIEKSMNESLRPVVDDITTMLKDFSNTVANNQVEGLSNIVDSFVSQMNESLSGNFEELGNVIEETCNLQRENNEFISGVINKIEGVAQNISDIEKVSKEIIDDMSKYIQEVESLQSAINESYMSVNIQLEDQKKYNDEMNDYIKQLVEYENNISQTSSVFMTDMEKQIEMIAQIEKEITEGTKDKLDLLAKNAEENNNRLAEACKKQIDQIVNISSSTTGDMEKATLELSKVSRDLNNQLANSLNTTFGIFDKNLADISQHLSGTIQQIDSTIENVNKSTDRVPKTVSAAYDTLKVSFEEMQKKVDGMIHAMDVMQRNITKVSDRFDKDWK